ncbi:MAG: FAD-dependent oxidoreductase [Pseudomonadales bacterium]
MKVAVIGSGVSGISAAWQLDRSGVDVTLYEAQRRIGGHTDTHSILAGGRTYSVDSGFIVFNEHNYPLFSAWLSELGVGSQPSDMSFGVSNRLSGLEYSSRGLRGLFCQRRNLVAPGFLSMLRDLRHFYREAPQLDADDQRTLGRFLSDGGYGDRFVHDHLAPMCAALWSLPQDAALELPVQHVLAFMSNHRMLQIDGRPQWRVVQGGSSTYLEAFAARFRGTVAADDPVQAVVRQPQQVVITSRRGRATFDAVVMACHSDQALALLHDASQAEREVLGAIGYERNRVVVHSDVSVMPRNRNAWASWNAQINDASAGRCQVTYWMNLLQDLGRQQQFFVTLNPGQPLRDVWCERDYAHPVFTAEALRAQARRAEISGRRNTFFCGAYWGWGFHEDGFVSGVAAAREVGQVQAHAA